MAHMQIGAVKLECPVVLAPMAGIADLPFRLLCRELGGVGLAGSELLNARAIVRGIPAICSKAMPPPEDSPLSTQIYGSLEDPLPQAAAWAVENGAMIIDINMGCPIDKVCKKNGGSLLMKTPEKTATLAKQIIDACDCVPVTAKVRLGWDEGELTAPEIAKRLEDVGISAITVHGRTTSQKFSGAVCLDGIAKVVEAVSIPVIGNGDINSVESAMQMFEYTGCSAVMVGRHAMKEPWIFDDISRCLNGENANFRGRNAKIEVILRHLELILEHRGERAALHCITNRIALYGRTLGHIKPLKERVRLAKSADEIREALEAWLTTETSFAG
ncbi:MAG: tRNA dihydrouridine synthase DusB [Phycisphaerae bacterium]|nr:tRNA dihydrouridine synthase DusB [Phycisphaerae bacterium]